MQKVTQQRLNLLQFLGFSGSSGPHQSTIWTSLPFSGSTGLPDTSLTCWFLSTTVEPELADLAGESSVSCWSEFSSSGAEVCPYFAMLPDFSSWIYFLQSSGFFSSSYSNTFLPVTIRRKCPSTVSRISSAILCRQTTTRRKCSSKIGKRLPVNRYSSTLSGRIYIRDKGELIFTTFRFPTDVTFMLVRKYRSRLH